MLVGLMIKHTVSITPPHYTCSRRVQEVKHCGAAPAKPLGLKVQPERGVANQKFRPGGEDQTVFCFVFQHSARPVAGEHRFV